MARDMAVSAGEGGLVWVVVVSKRGQELRAKAELTNQRFEVYLPMKLFEVVAGPKKGELRASPFFPSYLFARVSTRVEDWREIFSTYGVAGVLGCSMTRAYGLSDTFVQRIKDQEEGGYIKIGVPEAVPVLERGQRVRDLDTGIEGEFEAVFNERVDEARASFLVSCMGRQSRFVVDLRRLKAADPVAIDGKESAGPSREV